MRTLTSYASKFLLIFIFFCAFSAANAASNQTGRLIVIRVANFGWNLAANLKIDGKPSPTLSKVAVTTTRSQPGDMF
jgi:hypothetical protein